MLKQRCEQCAGSGVAYAVIPKCTVVIRAFDIFAWRVTLKLRLQSLKELKIVECAKPPVFVFVK